jgi:hypothetical protein
MQAENVPRVPIHSPTETATEHAELQTAVTHGNQSVCRREVEREGVHHYTMPDWALPGAYARPCTATTTA